MAAEALGRAGLGPPNTVAAGPLAGDGCSGEQEQRKEILQHSRIPVFIIYFII